MADLNARPAAVTKTIEFNRAIQDAKATRPGAVSKGPKTGSRAWGANRAAHAPGKNRRADTLPTTLNQISRSTKDLAFSDRGPEKSRRIDLGLSLLCLVAKPGSMFSYNEIAAWSGCTYDAISRIEKIALRKLRHRLRFGPERSVGQELVA